MRETSWRALTKAALSRRSAVAKINPTCSMPECERPCLARGLCFKHYARWRKRGDPSVTTRTEYGLPRRFFAETVLSHSGDDCLLWPFGRTSDGYGSLRVAGEPSLVHRLVCEKFHGPAPSPQHQACHSCGNGHLGCVTPKHIRWGTQLENSADTVAHNRSPRGERCGNSKVTEADVQKIRALAHTMTRRELAERFGISQGQVRMIQTRKQWAWLS